jgi:hypothetical protein
MIIKYFIFIIWVHANSRQPVTGEYYKCVQKKETKELNTDNWSLKSKAELKTR